MTEKVFAMTEKVFAITEKTCSDRKGLRNVIARIVSDEAILH
jgi:hypothetical protein